MNSLAPIILFVYNRPSHTQQTIEALLKNPLAKESEIFIYSDAPKDQKTQEKVQEVREYIHSITGFKNITIIERERNCGLADNIIDGVTTIINQYNKVIVLEDDIVVSPVFLNYMNDALNKYKSEKKVWNISAWNYPLDPNPIKEDTFFWRIPHCWGWATWKDRWQYFKRDIAWVENNFSKDDIYEISLHHTSDYWEHFLFNKKQKKKTWAIFWYLIAYKHQALTLMPKISFIKQIGFDSSGTNCFSDDPLQSDVVSNILPSIYPSEIIESMEALHGIMDFHKKHRRNIFQKITSRLKRFFS